MMNLLSICIVMASLLAAEMWSPNPQRQKEDVIVKEGHRVIVVETFDEGGKHNTKVSISPQQQPEMQPAGEAEGVRGEEHAFSVPNLGFGMSGSEDGERHVPGELICDAFGRCKHKIAEAFGKVKEKVSGSVQEGMSKQKEMMEDKKESVLEGVHEMGRKAHGVKEKVENGYQRGQEVVAEQGRYAYRKGKDVLEQAAESVVRKAREMEGKCEEEEAKTVDKAKEKQASMNLSKLSKTMVEKGSQAKARIASRVKATSLLGMFTILGFSVAYGTCIWVTFISSFVLAGALPKQQFAVVQSKIYPVYFRVMAASVTVTLLGFLVLRGRSVFSSKSEMFQVYNLMASILLVLANSLYFEPSATKAMFERMKMEKEDGTRREAEILAQQNQMATKAHIGGVSKRLKKLNSYSSFLNILTLISLTWHLAYLGQCYQAT